MRLREYYDGVAGERTPYYQQATGPMQFLLHGPVERHIDRQVKRVVGRVESVADIGCGFGRYLVGLDRVRRVFLNDLSEKMIEVARADLQQRYPEISVTSQAGDARSISVDEAGRHDLVMSVGVVNHLAEDVLVQALDVMAQLAQKKILLCYAHRGFLLSRRVGVSFRRRGIHYRSHSRRVIEAALATRGFRVSRSSYTFGPAILSPLVLQEFDRNPADAGVTTA
jgi:SAM-dependent methyltransferase